MSLGITLAPAGVPLAVTLRLKDAQHLASTICSAWDMLSPQVIADYNPAEHPGTRHIIVDLNDSYYRQLTEDSKNLHQRFTLLQYTTAERLYESLVSQLTIAMITSLVGKYQLFHAAALGDPYTGRALALVAESGTGKTTAARFLGQHLTYITDETVIVDEDYELTPYLKPLSVIVDPARPKEQISPQAAGLKVPETGEVFRLTQLLLLAREQTENYTSPRLVPLEAADALLAIVSQTSGIAKTERGIEKLLELLDYCGGALRLEYSEISETLPLIQQLLRGEKTMDPVQKPQSFEVSYATEKTPVTGEIARAAHTSGYRFKERVLLMHDTQLTEVSLFAGDIWFELEQPLEVAELHARLEKLYEQKIPAEAIERSISALLNLGTLVRG